MRRQFWRGDGARHREAAFEQRPVERLAVEGHQHGPLGDARGKFMQQRMLFCKIAHEELLDLQSAGIPPGQTHEKRIRAGAAREPRRFRVQKKPFHRIR